MSGNGPTIISLAVERGPMRALGTPMLFFAAVCLIICIGMAVFSVDLTAAFLIPLSGVVLFGGLGVMLTGLARANPVGLRMDADGVSGWYVPPLEWHEIADAGLVNQGGAALIGFLVRDADAYLARQGRGRRMFLQLNRIGNTWTVLVPFAPLEEADPQVLLETAQQRIAAARPAATAM